MSNKKTKVAFQGTPEQEAQLKEFIAATKGEKGAAMPILQKAQEIYGYLPEEVQMIISEETGIPLSELYGISTFYAQFSLNPKGQHQVNVCLGTACYVKGSSAVLDKACSVLNCEPNSITADGRFSVDVTRCVGACGLAPVMIVDGEVYGRMVPEAVEGILKKYM